MAGKVIGVGSALVDQLSYIPESFLGTVRGAKGGMELVEHEELSGIVRRLPQAPVSVPGGSAANTAVGVARLGAPCALLAKVGEDADGSFYVSAAVAAGLSAHAFKRTAALPTGRCLSLITPDSERTMRTYLGAAGTLAPEEVSAADFAGYEVVHIEGYLLFNPALIIRVLECAKEAGATVSLDLASPEVVRAAGDRLPALIRKYVDIVFANEAETREYTGIHDEDEGLERLRRDTAMAVVKVGARGAKISHGGGRAHVEACKVLATDTTGAGDSWAAGFLYGLGSGMDIEQAGRVGAMVSAEVVQITGAALPEETWARLRTEINRLG